MAFAIFGSKFLGIDIGTETIKIIELSLSGRKPKLENFAQVTARAVFKDQFRSFTQNTFSLSINEVIKAIEFTLREAEIKTKKAFFSIPDFATFFTIFELPPMAPEEINLAVEAEARRHIPVPLTEVVFNWQIVNPERRANEKIRILLVAVPHEVVNQYTTIASSLKLKLMGLEAEVFSLARALGEEGKVVAIFDLGARSTTCSIVEGKVLYNSFSLDVGGDFLTERIAKSLQINLKEGERLKQEIGLREGTKVREILSPLINSILQESEKFFQHYSKTRNREIQKIILCGGNAHLPGLLEYFKMYLKKEIEIGNPFKQISYPSALEKILMKMSSSYAIAVGLALKGFEK